MTPKDEDIQKQLESGEPVNSGDVDVKAYLRVFDALKKEPEAQLRHGFEHRVVNRLLARESESSYDVWWLAGGIFLLVICVIVAFVMSGATMRLGFLNIFSDFKGLFAVAAILLAIFQWLDKKLVTRKEM